MRYTEESPYGYWISKDEIIPVISEECHAEIAIEKILRRDTKSISVYSVMFRLGYVRVINYQDGGYGVEFWKGAKLSKLQKEFIQDAEDKDCVDYRHNNERAYVGWMLCYRSVS